MGSTGLCLIVMWVTNSSMYSGLLARISTGAQWKRWPGDMTATARTKKKKNLKCNPKRRYIWTDSLERNLDLESKVEVFH